MTREYMTTGQVAKLANMDARVIAQYFDSGELAGFILPGCRHRRIRADSAHALLVRLGIDRESLRLEFDLNEIPRNS